MKKEEVIGSLMAIERERDLIDGVDLEYATNLLKSEVATFPENPSAELFERLHKTLISTHESDIRKIMFPKAGTEQDIKKCHRKQVMQLCKIAKKLGISYRKLEDPLFQTQTI